MDLLGTIAGQIGDENVGRVCGIKSSLRSGPREVQTLRRHTRLEANTVVSVVNGGIRDGNVVAPEDVPSIRVLGGVAASRERGQVNVLVDNVLALVYLSVSI